MNGDNVDENNMLPLCQTTTTASRVTAWNYYWPGYHTTQRQCYTVASLAQKTNISNVNQWALQWINHKVISGFIMWYLVAQLCNWCLQESNHVRSFSNITNRKWRISQQCNNASIAHLLWTVHFWPELQQAFYHLQQTNSRVMLRTL